MPKLYNELISIDWSYITDYTNIDDDFNKLLDCFMNKYNLLSKSYRPHNIKIKQPWMTNALCTSCAVKYRMYKAMLNGNCFSDSYKMYRNKLTTTIRAAKAACFNNYINNHRLNARAIWNMINTHICHSNHISSNKTPLLANNLNRLNDFFANLGINTTKHLPKNNNHLNKLINPLL